MPTRIRLATFNVENLFERARLLNFERNEEATPKLELVEHLRDELHKDSYDKPRILDLYNQVREYVSIVEVREKLLDRSKKKVVAGGRGEWSGFIEFKREKFSEEARVNTGKVIKAVNADVFALVEVESRPVLQHFCGDRLKSGGNFEAYPHLMLIDGNDNRGIDVALMSRWPIANMRSHIDDEDSDGTIFSRDCLELELAVPSGKSLFLLINHFKSKGYGAQDAGDAKRKRQARRVATILENHNLKEQYVAVVGDFNDTPGSGALKPLLDTPDLTDVLAAQFPNVADRWTYYYKKTQQIDFLLVSKPLRDALADAGVERRGIWKVDQYSGGAIHPFSTVTGYRASASDHGAVWADFAIS